MLSFLQAKLKTPAASLGRYVLLLWRAFTAPPRELARHRADFSRQMMRLGLASLPIVMLAAAFTGGVTTVQAIYQMRSPLIPKSTIGAIVVPSMILELGVLVAAFILAGRVGARIAAEIGAMRASEQIDALEVMGLSAPGYLVAPRVVAGTLMFPVLYVAACVVGAGAGTLVASASGALTPAEFILGARSFFTPFDALYGCTKALVFGFIITSVACYKGYYVEGGAEGVGESTTEAAVTSCIFVLLADYVLAATLL